MERRIKQGRNEAAVEVTRLTKLYNVLQTDLGVELTGEPHLHVDDPAAITAVTVMIVELSNQRAYFQQLLAVFKSNQIRVLSSGMPSERSLSSQVAK